MITRILIRNFKMFEDVDVELGARTVLIGPNNSGKTSALQALALWELGLRRWNEKRAGKAAPEKRPGVTISRRDIISLPVSSAKLLWRDLHVRAVTRPDGRQHTANIFIDIIVEGVTSGKHWACGLEFYYANEESLYCRPLRTGDGKDPSRMPVPDEAASVRAAFLQPMSGLAANEPALEPGRINVLLGEGQTAQVLRNLCWQIYDQDEDHATWEELADHMRRLFGIALLPPAFIVERGEITMGYSEHGGPELDLASSGRGCQQTLLILAHLYANPNTVLLLDEPDAHLEMLRQRQTYKLISDVAQQQGSQVVAASHSEVLLNEAAEQDTLVAFVGKPHRIDDRGSQAAKSLKEIGFDQYYQAEQTGWVMYLEGSTDLAILQALAKTLYHEAVGALDAPFVHYVGNDPPSAQKHFHGLREAKPDIVGIAVFDRFSDSALPDTGMPALCFERWQRRELENYLCQEAVLMRYARQMGDASAVEQVDLFAHAREEAMREAIVEVTAALETLGEPSPWSPDIKASDDFLDRVFARYFEKLSMPNIMRKTNYHELANLILPDEIPAEVGEKLDSIVECASRATPA